MPNEIDLRYPIGKAEDQLFSNKGEYDEKVKAVHLQEIQMCPSLLENAISNLDEHQLATPYRQGGWTSKQVIHHVADSHMNAYVRFKLALTEDNPTIKPYDEAAWARLSDTQNLPVNISLTLLHALHARWVELMKNMTEEEWQRTIFHPEHKHKISLWNMLGTYAWHGKHHTAHITALRERMGWDGS
ncbi:MAG: putative metal-dependent hydrolase [Chitinophagaceae bacterium]|nr:putative metal-dependent hydrolase [Chitinophagaceae bacterium]